MKTQTHPRRQRGLTLVLALIACIAVSLKVFAGDRPNIVFMLSDDQSWSGTAVPMHPDAEYSYNKDLDTPSLAKMARQGMGRSPC